MLTKKEKKVIKELEKLAKEWPEDMWIFATGGGSGLNVMKYSLAKGDSGMAENKPGAGVDPNGIVAQIDIPCDGGDW